MKIIIAGSRTLRPYDSDITSAVDILLEESLDMVGEVEIVCGMAKGVDLRGKEWAERHNYLVKEFPADWEKEGRGAGYIRNTRMGEYADGLVAFWDGQSRGTKHMIDVMHELNKPFVVIIKNGQLEI